ncbi:hypothetical protein PsYK624_137720 [Phanerochaete sordida]|uniref:Uncharacterized protein n=1 Tax=Phanerochaete sordida TaxID=48140 RepID=A0A9P3GM62_9APHY|nr:hypothetical protein PsYK624_137720 [Phanerochaete sordida]
MLQNTCQFSVCGATQTCRIWLRMLHIRRLSGIFVHTPTPCALQSAGDILGLSYAQILGSQRLGIAPRRA